MRFKEVVAQCVGGSKCHLGFISDCKAGVYLIHPHKLVLGGYSFVSHKQNGAATQQYIIWLSRDKQIYRASLFFTAH